MVPILVDKAGFIALDTNRYSMPSDYARQTLTLRVDDVEVRVLKTGDEVARHPRCWGRRQVIELPEHRAALLKQRRAAHDLKGRDRPRAELPGIDALIQRWADVGRSLGSMVARTIQLLNAYRAPVLY